MNPQDRKELGEWATSPHAWPTRRQTEAATRPVRQELYRQLQQGPIVYLGLGGEQPRPAGMDAPPREVRIDARYRKPRTVRPPKPAPPPRPMPARYIEPETEGIEQMAVRIIDTREPAPAPVVWDVWQDGSILAVGLSERTAIAQVQHGRACGYRMYMRETVTTSAADAEDPGPPAGGIFFRPAR